MHEPTGNYAEAHTWKGDDCFGASLTFLELNLDKMGYCLVACNLSGANAFFVRKELVANKFLEPLLGKIISNRQDTTYPDTPQGVAPQIKLWKNRQGCGRLDLRRSTLISSPLKQPFNSDQAFLLISEDFTKPKRQGRLKFSKRRSSDPVNQANLYSKARI